MKELVYNKNMEIVYLDNAATTRPSAAVLNEMQRANEELYFNSAALYAGALRVKEELARATETIKNRLTRTGEGEVIFTSGATEGNNMVILGLMNRWGASPHTPPAAKPAAKPHLLVLSGEHSSVFAPAMHLKNSGAEVDFVPLLPTGEADTDALKRLVRSTTALFVFGMVNSDTGCVQNAAALVDAVRGVNPRVWVHCDAVQGFCKYDFDTAVLGLDSCVTSSHKLNGPKGVGALWLRKKGTLRPIMHGGSQQDLRPGTENNAAVLGFAEAVRGFETTRNYEKMAQLHARLLRGLPAGCYVNGINNNPYITNIQLPLPSGMLGQTVMNALSARGIYVGLGSACAATASKNRTLLAMSIPEAKTKQVLRISFGVNNTPDDVDRFLSALKSVIAQ